VEFGLIMAKTKNEQLPPGDAIAFDFRTVHGAPADTSPVTRRVFSARWVGADARFARRGGAGLARIFAFASPADY
jgi:ectoine hydroxylase-related dioxygenase (phytanoyl-CoA dioxygenase family)